ncbi:MAG TPA: copper amine oxidase N-terminal domain-containing protein [Firmicutes bacterium]|nr:copper amine oxidase N-terminal domain-containing protein [Candidatus Fermentithermobacillaceae bacterium]
MKQPVCTSIPNAGKIFKGRLTVKKKYSIVTGAIFLTVALATVGFAASPINLVIDLIVNDQEIKADVPPQIINGRTTVPIRWLTKALDRDV